MRTSATLRKQSIRPCFCWIAAETARPASTRRPVATHRKSKRGACSREAQGGSSLRGSWRVTRALQFLPHRAVLPDAGHVGRTANMQDEAGALRCLLTQISSMGKAMSVPGVVAGTLTMGRSAKEVQVAVKTRDDDCGVLSKLPSLHLAIQFQPQDSQTGVRNFMTSFASTLGATTTSQSSFHLSNVVCSAKRARALARTALLETRTVPYVLVEFMQKASTWCTTIPPPPCILLLLASTERSTERSVDGGGGGGFFSFEARLTRCTGIA